MSVGVIVVAERPLSDLLTSHGISWQVHERQPSVGAMWDGLSGGRLDANSKILVFSDSLMEGSPSDAAERQATARAIVAMANAGAHVFVAVWRPETLEELRAQILQAAAAHSIDADRLTYHFLPVIQGGRAVLDSMRHALIGEVDFPDAYGPDVDAPISRTGFTPTAPWTAPAAPQIPMPSEMPFAQQPASPPVAAPVAAPATPMAPVTPVAAPVTPHGTTPAPHMGAPASAAGDHSGIESADLALLNRPKLPGQMTITVTSSKGGSGKSTCALLLAGSIARAANEAGAPLSICLMDLDTRDGQVASMIGKFMPTALNIRVQPVWDEATIRRHLVRDDRLGIDTLLAPIRPRTADTVGPAFYRTMVRSLQRMYDVVIIDTSVQYLDPLIADVCLPEADEILFVTTLASTAVQGMARALREITAPVDESGMGIPRERLGIVVNQSISDVGMDRDQVLAAGLGVPVVGAIPLATKDVLTATNHNRMVSLLDHPQLGPAYNELARACLPGRTLSPWKGAPADPPANDEPHLVADRRTRLFRR